MARHWDRGIAGARNRILAYQCRLVLRRASHPFANASAPWSAAPRAGRTISRSTGRQLQNRAVCGIADASGQQNLFVFEFPRGLLQSGNSGVVFRGAERTPPGHPVPRSAFRSATLHCPHFLFPAGVRAEGARAANRPSRGRDAHGHRDADLRSFR